MGIRKFKKKKCMSQEKYFRGNWKLEIIINLVKFVNVIVCRSIFQKELDYELSNTPSLKSGKYSEFLMSTTFGFLFLISYHDSTLTECR